MGTASTTLQINLANAVTGPAASVGNALNRLSGETKGFTGTIGSVAANFLSRDSDVERQ